MDDTVPSLATIVENLARAQRELLRAAEAVPEDQWKTRPAERRGHLSAVDRAIRSRADKLLQKPPKSLPFFKRFHVPMMVVEARVIRLKTPKWLDVQTIREKEEMLAELR